MSMSSASERRQHQQNNNIHHQRNHTTSTSDAHSHATSPRTKQPQHSVASPASSNHPHVATQQQQHRPVTPAAQANGSSSHVPGASGPHKMNGVSGGGAGNNATASSSSSSSSTPIANGKLAPPHKIQPLPPPQTATNGHAAPSPPQLSQKAQGKARQVDSAITTAAPAPDDAPIPTLGAYIPPSRLFSSPSPPPTGTDVAAGHIPLETLKSELNSEDDGLIPLAAIIERVSSEAYEALQNLGETISSLDSATRRSRIYTTSLELRRQMIKLYILVKWSKGSKHMQHLKNIIGLIHEQSYQTVDAREHLSETRTILPNARERNHDIVTAIDVLSSGEPQGCIPRAIQDEAVGPSRFTDEEARKLIKELDQAIRVRLACDEILPLPLQSHTAYDVSDGRVRFKAPGLFDMSLTLSGSQSDDRWYLLSITFDYRITGPGEKRFPRDLWEVQKDGFIANANEILAPRAATNEGTDIAPDAAPLDIPDAPIVRLYDFLASQALEYQLDILAYQASESSRLLGRNTISFHWEERCLVVRYWSGIASAATSAAAAAKRKAWNPLQGGTIRLQVVPRDESSAKERLVRSMNMHDGQDPTIREKKLVLQRTWEVDERLGSSMTSTATVDAQDLNFETIFKQLTTTHAESAMSVFEQRLEGSWLGDVARSCGPVQRQGPRLIFSLHAALTLSLSLDAQTGKLALEESREGKTAATNSTHRIAPFLSVSSISSSIREAALNLNAAPDQLVDILARLRTLAIRDDLQRKASYVGLPYVRRLNLNQEEYTKVGSQPTQLVYFPLQQSPTWYMFLAIQQQGLSGGVMCAVPLQYGTADATNASLVIQSLQWIEMDALAVKQVAGMKRKRGAAEHLPPTSSPQTSQAVITSDQLARLYSYTSAMTLTAQLEGQLRMRGLDFAYAPSSPPSTALAKHAEDLIPPITLRATELLGPSAASVLCTNVLLRLKEFWNPTSSHIRLVAHLSFRLPALVDGLARVDDGSGGPSASSVTLDPKRGILTFQTRDIAQFLEVFRFAWFKIARLASLASVLTGAAARKAVSAEIVAFDLRSMTFKYADGGRYSCIAQRGMSDRSPGHSLSFEDSSNPHNLLKPHLERLVNSNSTIPTARLWSSFLTLLDQTLPILTTLAPLYSKALDDVRAPDVIFLSATWYRIVWKEKYRLDCRFVKGGKAVVLYDGAGVLFQPKDEEEDDTQKVEPAVVEQAAIKSEPQNNEDKNTIDEDSFLNLDEDTGMQGTNADQKVNTDDEDDEDLDFNPHTAVRIPNLASIFNTITRDAPQGVVAFDEAILCDVTPNSQTAQKILESLVEAIGKQLSGSGTGATV